MKKAITVLLIVACASLTSLVANGNSEEKGMVQNKTKVSYWTLTPRKDAVEPIVQAFNKENPDIEVIPSFYNTDGLKDTCKIAASSKTLPNMWFNWGGALGGFYSDNGLTYNLNDIAKEKNWNQIFSKSALNLCTRNGELTGYPTGFSVLGFYYRKDIFAKYNIAVPQTFEEFEQACKTLSDNGIIPISTGGKYGWHVMRFVELLIEHYAGADLHDQMNTLQASYNNDAVIKALTKYQEFVTKGYFPQGFVTADPNDTKILVYAGKAAMDIQGQWNDGILQTDEQDYDNYGFFAFPSGGTNRMSSFVKMTQFNVDNTDKELAACIKFMDYYYNQENVAKYAAYYSLPLPRKNATMPEGQPFVPVMLQTANTNGTFTITDQALPTEVANVLFNVQDGLAYNQLTPTQGAKMIQDAITTYKNK